MQDPYEVFEWSAAWAWGVPIVAATVLMHVAGLSLIRSAVIGWLSRRRHRAGSAMIEAALLICVVVILVTFLHAIEAAIWGFLHVHLGAIPSMRGAMVYSLGALTTFGGGRVALGEGWQMLGAIEALNGMMLFGLTTAFLFQVIDRIWPRHI